MSFLAITKVCQINNNNNKFKIKIHEINIERKQPTRKAIRSNFR